MASSICPWPVLASPATVAPEVSRKSFAQAVSVDCDSQVTPLPPRVEEGVNGKRMKVWSLVKE